MILARGGPESSPARPGLRTAVCGACWRAFGRYWLWGRDGSAARLLHRIDAAWRTKERGADGGEDGSSANGGPASVAAALCRCRNLVGREGYGQGARDGAAGDDERGADRGLDHRRHLVPQAGQAFGRRAPSVLRSTGQAGQLPGDGVAVDCQSRREPSGRLSAVPAGGLDQGSCTAEEGGRAEGYQVHDQTGDRTRADPVGVRSRLAARCWIDGRGLWQ